MAQESHRARLGIEVDGERFSIGLKLPPFAPGLAAHASGVQLALSAIGGIVTRIAAPMWNARQSGLGQAAGAPGEACAT